MVVKVHGVPWRGVHVILLSRGYFPLSHIAYIIQLGVN